MTHRDGLPRFSARSAQRGDAGHRETSATLSESLGKPPFRSSMRPVGGRRKALTMHHSARGFPPTRRAAWTIPIGHYHRSLVLDRLDEAGHDLFAAGLLEGDFQLGAVDGDDLAIAEFLMEDAFPDLKAAVIVFLGQGLERNVLDDTAAALLSLWPSPSPSPGRPPGGVENRRVVAQAKAGARRPAAAVKAGLGADVHVFGGQFVDKPGRRRALPLAVDSPVGGEADEGVAARPGQADIGQAAFFLQPGGAAVVQRPRVREQPFLPTGQEHGVELRALAP